MNTHQLQCVINCENNLKKNTYGVFASDEISDICLKPKTGLIANTDVKRLTGKHWVAFYLSENNILEVFDSFGSSIDQLSIYFKHFLRKYSKIEVSQKRLQSEDTAVCGQYCLFFLLLRVNGYSMREVLDMFSNNYHSNDQFVYDIINEYFHCCITFGAYKGQETNRRCQQTHT